MGLQVRDNYGLDSGGTNELFRVTEQGSDMRKAVFKEDQCGHGGTE